LISFLAEIFFHYSVNSLQNLYSV